VSLIAGSAGRDEEFGALRSSRGVVALGIDAVVGVLAVALPRDDEIAVGVHRRGGKDLAVSGVGVDAELRAGGSDRQQRARFESFDGGEPPPTRE